MKSNEEFDKLFRSDNPYLFGEVSELLLKRYELVENIQKKSENFRKI